MKAFEAAFVAAWAMEEAALKVLLDIAARHNEPSPEALEAYKAKSLENADRAKVRDGVAVLDVRGPLFKRANLMTAMSGATSYDVLRRDLQAALDDPSVNSILLNVDSPGGEASGVGEFANAVAQSRGKKPIVAYVGDLGASAAYWIASAADKIMIGEGAALGSIGVRAAYSDTSARDEKSGVKTYDFVSSQSPFKRADPGTADGRDRIQSRVDALADVFIDTVARNRDVPRAKVLEGFGKGDVLIGKAAIAAGMADGLGSFESVLADLSARKDPFAVGGGIFGATGAVERETMKDEISAPGATTPAVETVAATVVDTTAIAATARTEAVTAERARVAKIMTLTLPGYEKKRDEAIESGSTAEDFAAMIIASEKVKSEARAEAVATDVETNANVKPVEGKTVNADEVQTAVDKIVKAHALARGE